MVRTYRFRSARGLLALAACGVGMPMMQYAVAAPPGAHARGGAPASLSAGLAGGFEGKLVTGKRGAQVRNHGKEIGWGWMATADKRFGGHSHAAIAMAHPGADGTQGALAVSGKLESGFVAPWAGAIWFPGSHPMQPTDLSGVTTLSFKVRGKPGSYTLLLMNGSMKGAPQSATFTIGKGWTQVDMPLAKSFPGADLKHVYFVAFSAGTYGKFDFELDQVRLH